MFSTLSLYLLNRKAALGRTFSCSSTLVVLQFQEVLSACKIEFWCELTKYYFYLGKYQFLSSSKIYFDVYVRWGGGGWRVSISRRRIDAYNRVFNLQVTPYCKGCNLKKNLKPKNRTEYSELKKLHVCQCNYIGSACGFEMV